MPHAVHSIAVVQLWAAAALKVSKLFHFTSAFYDQKQRSLQELRKKLLLLSNISLKDCATFFPHMQRVSTIFQTKWKVTFSKYAFFLQKFKISIFSLDIVQRSHFLSNSHGSKNSIVMTREPQKILFSAICNCAGDEVIAPLLLHLQKCIPWSSISLEMHMICANFCTAQDSLFFPQKKRE